MNLSEAMELLETFVRDPLLVDAVYGAKTRELLQGAISMLLEHTQALQSLTTTMAQLRQDPADLPVQVGDVIQLDPDKTTGGPLLCVVHKMESDRVRVGTWLKPDESATSPGGVFVWVKPGEFVRIGRSHWVPDEVAEEMQEGD